ncbi:hypothetical protein T484DRAFT_1907302 [Baffinella frigidus]|nr:hypothetical protein T484DRAFT_1907302 [Cryptophyta sp. CCMP2293]
MMGATWRSSRARDTVRTLVVLSALLLLPSPSESHLSKALTAKHHHKAETFEETLVVEEEWADDDALPEEEEAEERFSYLKEAEREVRKAEEREAEKDRVNDEYLARKARGELTEEEARGELTEEELGTVRDTLRWPEPSQGGSKLKAGKKEKERGGERGERDRGSDRGERDRGERDRGKGRERSGREREEEPRSRDGRESRGGRHSAPVLEEEDFTEELGAGAAVEEEEEVVVEEEVPEETVTTWLDKNNLGQYAQAFDEEGWDSLDAVASMSEADLLQLGIKRGHVRRMMLALHKEKWRLGTAHSNLGGRGDARGDGRGEAGAGGHSQGRRSSSPPER